MHWYSWYWAKYESDTLHLNLEQDAIYRRLIDWYMSHQSPIPDNDQAICSICRITADKWSEHSEVIRAFFRPRGNKLTLKLCDEQLHTQKLKSEARSKAATIAANVRHGNIKPDQRDECDSHAERSALAMRFDATDQQTYQQTDITDQTKRVVNGLLHASGLVGEDYVISLETADKLKDIAYGWDQHELARKYNAWHKGQDRPNNPDAAFLGWARRFTKGKRPN